MNWDDGYRESRGRAGIRSAVELSTRIEAHGGRASAPAIRRWDRGGRPDRANLAPLFRALEIETGSDEEIELLRAWADLPPRSVFDRPIVVVDTETTGLPRDDTARIIEIGAVALDQFGVEIGSFASYVCPDVLTPAADVALAINGITRERIQAAPQRSTVIEAWDLWYRAHGAPLLVAYNAEFDAEMFRRAGWDTPAWWCLFRYATAEIGDPINLANACREMGVERAGIAHRALPDARTAAELFRAFGRVERAGIEE